MFEDLSPPIQELLLAHYVKVKNQIQSLDKVKTILILEFSF